MAGHRGTWTALFVLVFAVACAGQPEAGPVVIGVAWPEGTQRGIWDGIGIAHDEIGRDREILDGRAIKVEYRDDGSREWKGMEIARDLAQRSDAIAVIGHYDSSISVPVSAIYQDAGKLMLSPGSTNPQLTQQGFDLVFRSIPTDEAIGEALARYAARRGYRRMLILAAKNTYGRGLSNIFERHADRLQIEIVDRRSYPQGCDAPCFERILDHWAGLEYEAILIAGTMPEAARFVRLLGSLAEDGGMEDVSILGGDGLFASELWEEGGAAAEGTVVVAPCYLDGSRDEVKGFEQQLAQVCEAKYGEACDTPSMVWAAQGYDAFKLLVQAMEKANSADANVVAQELGTPPDWVGLCGTYKFDAHGDVDVSVDKKPVVLLQVVKREDSDYRFEHLDPLLSGKSSPASSLE